VGIGVPRIKDVSKLKQRLDGVRLERHRVPQRVVQPGQRNSRQGDRPWRDAPEDGDEHADEHDAEVGGPGIAVGADQQKAQRQA
jgi:hypothetical protein